VQTIQRIGHAGHRAVEAESVGSGFQVVIDRLGHADHGKAGFPELLGGGERARRRRWPITASICSRHRVSRACSMISLGNLRLEPSPPWPQMAAMVVPMIVPPSCMIPAVRAVVSGMKSPGGSSLQSRPRSRRPSNAVRSPRERPAEDGIEPDNLHHWLESDAFGNFVMLAWRSPPCRPSGSSPRIVVLPAAASMPARGENDGRVEHHDIEAAVG